MKPERPQNKIVTDSELMEAVEHGTQDYPFQFYDEHMAQFDFNCIAWHWHNELEFFYLASGSVQVNVGSACITVSEGQGAFINTKVLHRFTSTEDAKLPNFLYHPTFLAPENSLLYHRFVAPVLSSTLQYQVFTSQIPWQQEILSLMQEIICLQGKPENELLTSALLQRLWHILYTNLRDSLVQQAMPHDATAQAKVQMMMSYIQTHYAEEITLEDIAKEFLFSKTTILSLFREYLQISPINYLIQYRLTVAAQLLLNSKKKLASIALETGFHNVEYFCRAFKKHYHMTPSEYRTAFSPPSLFAK